MGIIINDNEFTLDEIIYMLDLTNNIPLSKEDISLENIQSKIPNESIARNIHDFLTDEYEVDTEKVYFKVVELDDSDATNTMRNNYLPSLGDGKQRLGVRLGARLMMIILKVNVLYVVILLLRF